MSRRRREQEKSKRERAALLVTARTNKRRLITIGHKEGRELKDYTSSLNGNPTPGRPGGSGGPQQKTAKEKQDAQDQVLSFSAGATHQPPWFTSGLAWFGIVVGLLANGLQVYTSDIAYQHMISTNEVFMHMNKAGQDASQFTIQLICFGVSLVFQLGLMFFVFRITNEMKNTKTPGMKGMDQLKHTAVSIIDHQKILLLWTVIAAAYDTLGDFNFIGLYTDDPLSIFIYAVALYAASTILLSKSLEVHWASAVAYANWKSFKIYLKIQEAKAALTK
jgi:hypothetical protein